MDWYCYFARRLEGSKSLFFSSQKCRAIVEAMLSNHHIPASISCVAAIGFLAALRDYNGDGSGDDCRLGDQFIAVQSALDRELRVMRNLVGYADEARHERLSRVREDPDGPAYDPGEYN